MQLYRGLPIITNKIPPAEQKNIPHHLLGEIGLEEPTWTVSDFVRHAQTKIREIRGRGRVPILVGGTHYYTQSLLFEDALADNGSAAGEGMGAVGDQTVSNAGSGVKAASSTTGKPGRHDNEEAAATGKKDAQDPALTHPILSASPQEILAKLRQVDPIMADRWHPNDHRKIRRSLEIYLQTGRPASEVYSAQHKPRPDPSSPNSTSTNPTDGDDAGRSAAKDTQTPTLRLRTPTLILWIHATNESLHPRLDSRVDKMLARGLLSEVSTLSSFAASSPLPIDTSRGIYVSIGYKEFLPYTTALLTSLSPESEGVDDKVGNDDDPTLHTLLTTAIERTKISTRQYAKSQTRWLRTKLISSLALASQTPTPPHLYLLDGSDITHWETSVSSTALSLVSAFLANDHPLPPPTSLSDLAKQMLEGEKGKGDMGFRREAWERRTCETCRVVSVTESDWRQHLGSKKHKMGLRKAKAVAEGRVEPWRLRRLKKEGEGRTGEDGGVVGGGGGGDEVVG